MPDMAELLNQFIAACGYRISGEGVPPEKMHSLYNAMPTDDYSFMYAIPMT